MTTPHALPPEDRTHPWQDRDGDVWVWLEPSKDLADYVTEPGWYLAGGWLPLVWPQLAAVTPLTPLVPADLTRELADATEGGEWQYYVETDGMTYWIESEEVARARAETLAKLGGRLMRQYIGKGQPAHVATDTATHTTHGEE